MKQKFGKIIFILLQLGVLGSVIFPNQTAFAQTNRSAAPAFRPELIYQPKGNFSNNVARPLRYWPVGTRFCHHQRRGIFQPSALLPEFRLPH